MTDKSLIGRDIQGRWANRLEECASAEGQGLALIFLKPITIALFMNNIVSSRVT